MTFYIPKKALLMCATRLRVNDVFATSLYPGNNGTQTITNGLDLAGKGGLWWAKSRTNNLGEMVDTVRGINSSLQSFNTTGDYAGYAYSDVTSFNKNGVSLGYVTSNSNAAGQNFVGWSFRRAKKFFDIVTYTGNGQSGRQIPHGLGDVPGMIVVKSRDTAVDWPVWHRSLTGFNILNLNLTNAAAGNTAFAGTAPDASSFTVGTAGATNSNGVQYVAYLFAHNPDLISCGNYTGNGLESGNPVTCGKGWVPQFVLIKAASTTGGWWLFDTARGIRTNLEDPRLEANTSQEELNNVNILDLTSTGFTLRTVSTIFNGSGQSYVYMAIRSPT